MLGVTAIAFGCDTSFLLDLFRFSNAFWIALGLSVLLDTLGNILLVKSVGAGELSVVGPLNSYKPVIATGLGWSLFGEQPDFLSAIGILLIVVGSWFLLSKERGEPKGVQASNHFVVLRLLSIVFTSIASLFLKSAIEEAGDWRAFQAWAIGSTILAAALCFVPSLSRSVLRMCFEMGSGTLNVGKSCNVLLNSKVPDPISKQSLRSRTTSESDILKVRENDDLKALKVPERFSNDESIIEAIDSSQNPPHRSSSVSIIGDYIYLSLSLFLMQGLTIWLFARMPVGYALALFQLATLVQVILGARLFGEGNQQRRLIAALIMSLGATIILFNQA